MWGSPVSAINRGRRGGFVTIENDVFFRSLGGFSVCLLRSMTGVGGSCVDMYLRYWMKGLSQLEDVMVLRMSVTHAHNSFISSISDVILCVM
jgi:hypothetical protein